MTKLTNHYEDSKLAALAGHLDGQVARLMEIRNQNSNRMIVLQEGSTTWPVQFGDFIGSLTSRKPRYHIESIVMNEEDGTVEVEYCREEDYQDFEKGLQAVGDIVWYEDVISCSKLRAFALEEKMNHYCKDWADHAGDHQQEAGVIPIENLMDQYDFLQEVTKDYLEAGKEVE